jgi:peptidoglycan/xylan/chitin deacetylase (PgdA/CDA1 family)
MTGSRVTPAAPAPRLSVVALTRGPERLAERALRAALGQLASETELLVAGDAAAIRRARRQLDALDSAPAQVRFVETDSAKPGAARNAAVRAARAAHVLLADGGETMTPGYAVSIVDHVADMARVALVLPVRRTDDATSAWMPVAARDAVAGPWSFGSSLVLARTAFDRLGGFDDALPEFVEWEWLLRAVAAGEEVLSAPAGARRASDDDVPLRESLRSERHLPAVRQIVGRHHAFFSRRASEAVASRERLIADLRVREAHLRAERAQAEAELGAARGVLAGLSNDLAVYGRRTLEFEDLRRTAPISRNWGLDRGMPIDRHYIHAFMGRHAGDVRGDVLEMLDAELTTSYGRERVRRSDILDIDPGNHRATVVADLRSTAHMPENAYDCFILTQTIHLIDDMASVLANAHRALKPGGVLLMTLPCASMVAVEYGPRGDHWRVTEAGARALTERAFEASSVEVRGYGNVLTTTAFLYGLGCDDLAPRELEEHDPAYPMLITVRARKADAPAVVAWSEGRPSAVLLYHRVASLPRDVHRLAVTPEAFRSQLATLTHDWQVVPLGDLAPAAASGHLRAGRVALTFDDGYLDNLDVVLPILEEFAAPATFFLTTAALGRPQRYWWDVLEAAVLDNPEIGDELSLEIEGRTRAFPVHDAAARRATHDTLYGMIKARGPASRDALVDQLAALVPAGRFDPMARPLLLDEVRRAARHPLVDVGAHTVHHLSLSTASPDDLFRDVFESRSALERAIGVPVRHFAYPYGDLSPAAVRTVEAAGFDAAVTCEERLLRRREHPLRVPRLATCEESGASLGSRLSAMAGATPGPSNWTA